MDACHRCCRTGRRVLHLAFFDTFRGRARCARTAIAVISLFAVLAVGPRPALAQQTQTAVCSDMPDPEERIECTENDVSRELPGRVWDVRAELWGGSTYWVYFRIPEGALGLKYHILVGGCGGGGGGGGGTRQNHGEWVGQFFL